MAKRGRPRKHPHDTVAGRAELKRKAKTTHRMGQEELSIYASGNGALSFVWQALDYEIGSKIATGRRVTPEDVREWLKGEKGQTLIQEGWKLWTTTGGEPYLAPPVKRLGSNTLQVKDQTYRYECGLPLAQQSYDPQQIMHNIRVFTRPTLMPEEFETKHIGTISSIAFFLAHEKDLEVSQ